MDPIAQYQGIPVDPPRFDCHNGDLLGINIMLVLTNRRIRLGVYSDVHASFLTVLYNPRRTMKILPMLIMRSRDTIRIKGEFFG